MIEIAIGNQTAGFVVDVFRNGVPQLNETVVLKIGNRDVLDSWLDFSDNTFKTSGWVQKSIPMVGDPSEPGLYKVVWNSSIAITGEEDLFVQYEIPSGPNQSVTIEELRFTAATAPTNNSVLVTQNTLDLDQNAIGIVRTPSNMPVQGATVNIYADSDTGLSTVLFSGLSDGNGGFSILVTSPATYRLVAFHSGYYQSTPARFNV